jgi:hypothetical protein
MVRAGSSPASATIHKTMRILVTLIFLILLSSCSLQHINRQPCPAYVENAIPAGTYDYSGPYECGVWYENKYCWIWSSTSKEDALELWTRITGRPMYFEIQGGFRYTVKAQDGYNYYFWRFDSSEYIVTAERPRKDWDRIPL